MDSARIGQVRRFNRIVTQRVGALHEQFLARARPLGQSRLLWEIGPAGCDVRRLRLRLGLDSGYLSRLLRSLEQEGLVTVVPGSTDARVRMARLTTAGLAERAELDRRSDAVAESILGVLSDGQQARLVAAMADVERLLTASQVIISAADPRQPAARSCLLAYFRELADRFKGGFDPELSNPAHEEEMTPPAGLFLLATLYDEPVGCGALKFHPDAPAEIKRMWVSPAARGLGLGRRILTELEKRAIARGAAAVRLETNRTLAEAISLYRSSGYREVEPFNAEPYAHHWFEKALPHSV
jgi:DNA-binding MarR family transcriptional regulator/N-acetylglutamate synthase-like GNAT family acetyltransferase